jgi:hypothetical protein
MVISEIKFYKKFGETCGESARLLDLSNVGAEKLAYQHRR